ncbi:short-chain dehydrogenase/reductase family Oxidoreductase [Colletotrichum karsti]|uniref:Short-chain dehydrogenase/reductase family Oxidoreductase n=1 Tax=Colletotrichum karsti TaxID=1095194 RepID=A0A9P6IIT8_9PEZI|nr:short-chain dehydrogenase/reductase family Oxidoreductase [Colletotrichum karsti]KAF9880420.1 short-chain dehydrogenase/reductase family Oxidoreductase [Colletotrichum karsti]
MSETNESNQSPLPSYEEASSTGGQDNLLQPTTLVLDGQTIHALTPDSPALYRLSLGIADLSGITKEVELSRVEPNKNGSGRKRHIYDLKHQNATPGGYDRLPSDSPRYFIHRASRRLLDPAALGMKKGSALLPGKAALSTAVPVDVSGKTSKFGIPNFIKDAAAVFSTNGREWSDAQGNAVAVMHDDKTDKRHSLIVTAALPRGQFDMLVALWCCHVWEFGVANAPKVHEGMSGGTAGLGKSTIRTLLAHNPSHIYFSGRSLASAEALIASVTPHQPSTSPTNLDSPSPSSNTPSPPPLTFIQMDLTSLPSITTALAKSFTHARLDILVNNAGIMAGGPGLSADGFEIQFATNHLGHAMLVRALLPVLQRTAAAAAADVRIVNLTSVGYRGHPSDGISFATLRTEQRGLPVLGQWIRYGQSKLANILFTKELARRYPAITSVAVHPGVVDTGLVTNQGYLNRLFVYAPQKIMGATVLTPEQGCWNQVWAAAAARREDLVNGAFYMPVGHLADHELDSCATDEKLAGELWAWTEKVLDEFD